MTNTRILIVEDDPCLAVPSPGQSGLRGYSVECAADSASALACPPVAA